MTELLSHEKIVHYIFIHASGVFTKISWRKLCIQASQYIHWKEIKVVVGRIEPVTNDLRLRGQNANLYAKPPVTVSIVKRSLINKKIHVCYNVLDTINN